MTRRRPMRPRRATLSLTPGAGRVSTGWSLSLASIAGIAGEVIPQTAPETGSGRLSPPAPKSANSIAAGGRKPPVLGVDPGSEPHRPALQGLPALADRPVELRQRAGFRRGKPLPEGGGQNREVVIVSQHVAEGVGLGDGRGHLLGPDLPQDLVVVPEVFYLLAPLVQPLVGGQADRPGEPGAPQGVDAPDAASDPFPSVAGIPSVDAAVSF